MLAAHQRRPRPRDHLLDSRDAFGEERARRHLLIVRDAAVPGTPAEFAAQEHVADAGGVETFLQRGAIEVRQPRNGVRSDVDHNSDLGPIKQALERRLV